ncbi:MAG: TadE family protein [Bacilli bacterium]|jgi:Flp pilus assembly protein TadG|nr:TadE family protein [Bacilli bacterium]
MIRKEEGQSLTEFALLVPLLLLLICGILDFGRVMYAYLHLNLAAQETVRLAGLGKGDSVITTFAKNYEQLGDANLLQVTISPSQASRKSGDYVKVTLSYTLSYLTPVISNILPQPVITVDSTIRVE